MRCLRGSEGGASRVAMKSIYIAQIRSVLDYGRIVYDSAAKTLNKLDVIQAQALRLCCSAFKRLLYLLFRLKWVKCHYKSDESS